jgi:hypothetical protein
MRFFLGTEFVFPALTVGFENLQQKLPLKALCQGLQRIEGQAGQ